MILAWSAAMLALLSFAAAFDNSRGDNNSYGQTHPTETANFQQPLSFYCQDDTIDVIPIAYLNVFFDAGGLPSINLANICGGNVFPGTNLANCQFLAADIQACQSRGKLVTLSLGGMASGAGFESVCQAADFAQTIWDLFLGGSSSMRPFGNVVLDGIDLDLVSGSSIYYSTFVERIRTFSGYGKQYYFSAAPECPYPDQFLNTVLSETWFDALYIQFYNNERCALPTYPNQGWDYGVWDTWARSSLNPSIKLYIGAPASPTATGSGYVDVNTLAAIAIATRSQYSSFGGVMLWDASQAYMNNRYHSVIKDCIRLNSLDAPLALKASTSTRTSLAPPHLNDHRHIAAWRIDLQYPADTRVLHNGHLWAAERNTTAEIPGGREGAWADKGSCSGSTRPPATLITYPSSTPKAS